MPPNKAIRNLTSWDNPLERIAAAVRKQNSPLVVGALTPPPSYVQDDFYLAEVEARRTARDRMLTGPEIQAYVDEVQAMPWPQWQPRASWPAEVTILDTAIPYYRSGKIAVPSPVRELIVLHELAHHFVGPRRPAHQPQFVQAFLDLVEQVRNPAQADHFRVVFMAYGVKW